MTLNLRPLSVTNKNRSNPILPSNIAQKYDKINTVLSSCTSLHQQGGSRKDRNLQVLRCSHLWWSVLVTAGRCNHQECSPYFCRSLRWFTIAQTLVILPCPPPPPHPSKHYLCLNSWKTILFGNPWRQILIPSNTPLQRNWSSTKWGSSFPACKNMKPSDEQTCDCI